MTILPTVRKPTVEEVTDIAGSYGITLDEENAKSFQELIAGFLPAYWRADELIEPRPEVKYARTPGYRPSPEENEYNAWYWRCEVQGRKRGLLAGKTVALKDNICLAGVPMMNGSRILEGYVPEIDATVVTRMLDAGAVIKGKAANEDLCLSGSSFTTALGMVKNPHKPTHSAGGSSCGSAALVAAGEVDIAMGGDQGGSIRIPACWSGVYGHKPTHGLVPYTGVFPIEQTIDHTGPMCNNVADIATAMEVLAGPDGLDPRQIGCKTQNYRAALKGGVKGLKIAVVKEGFGHESSEAAVDRKTKAALDKLKKAGATVKEVSIPMHLDGLAIWTLIAVEGLQHQMVKYNAFGLNWKGLYLTSLQDKYAHAWRCRGDDFSETTKLCIILGEYLERNYYGHYYAKGQNLSLALRAEYDKVLGDYDVLAMPTLPMQATPLPEQDCSREEYIDLALTMIPNTSPFDATGHPAMSVPCGMNDGLPIGLMFVGARYDDASVIRVAAAFEKLGNWMKM